MRPLALIAPSLLLMAGCAGYHMGSRSLYAPDVATVYVPIIESESFRPNLGERLTEAVAKEIELKTPYKVVGNPDADSILACRLINDTKRVLVENQFDEPREIETKFFVEVRWINRRRELLREPSVVPLNPASVGVSQDAVLIPEAGQSLVVAQQTALDRMADQIVATMEAPW